MSLDPAKFSPAIWPSQRVRDTFVNFFCEKHAHKNIKSSPVVPLHDPTLLFTNSGMNQFKPVFLGQVDPTSELASVKRVANTQKCIRAGGKHNDLDDVGKDSYHHTFFEMLGSWSFGDYFKTDAIDWAWELLTVVYGLPPERLYATYFKGDEKNNIPRDDEAKARWLKYLPEGHVLPFGAKENFWEMGDTGPCGPCTEIHFDLKGGRDAAALVNRDDPTVIEIWNLVFMQFNRNADQSLTPLPNKHVDTGAGLERFVGVLQNQMSNYDSDLFVDLFVEIQKATGDAQGYTKKYYEADIDSHDMAYRVVADHIRTLTFALTDGAVPDSDGRGYVLRRIVRRAVRYGTQVLKAKPGFFHKLVPAVVAKMKDVFPEIAVPANVENVTRIIKREEELFMRTLDNGTKRLGRVLDKLEADANGQKQLAGAEMWDMYSTFGFPPDLTELMCAERKVGVDKAGYEAASAAFRVQRSTGTLGAVAMPSLDMHATDHLQKTAVAPTDDAAKYAPEHRSIHAKIVALFSNGAFVDKLQGESGYVGVLLDRTNFYAEAGGQVADVGELRHNNVTVFDVVDVQNYAGYLLHVGRLRGGAAPATALAVGESVHTLIDGANRARVTANHTTTHMLNWSLRRTCGHGVEQKGSKVVAESLRFDFAHDGPVGAGAIAKVDALVNDIIARNLPVYYKEVATPLARAVNGLTAVFGEKYPDPVRMVTVGVPIDELLAQPASDWGAKYSIEFCGGTHLKTSGEAGSYVTLSELGVAQGVRRIVGATGAEATAARANAEAINVRLGALEAVKTQTDESRAEHVAILHELETQPMPMVDVAAFRERLDALLKAKNAAFKDRTADDKSNADAFVAATLAAHAATPLKFVAAAIDCSGNQSVLLNVAHTLALKGLATLVVSAEPAGKKAKVVVVAVVPPTAAAQLSAPAWAQAACVPFGGKAGGKPDKAQGSFEALDKAGDSAKLAAAFAEAAFK